MKIKIEDVRKLREEIGAGVADCREALKFSKGDMEKARQWLKKKGLGKASKKMEREVKSGIVEVYSHAGKIGVLVEILCETDFVAHTPDFKNLAHELALQIASMNPENVQALLKQEYIRDPALSVEDLVRSVIGKLGENIKIGRFERVELGE